MSYFFYVLTLGIICWATGINGYIPVDEIAYEIFLNGLEQPDYEEGYKVTRSIFNEETIVGSEKNNFITISLGCNCQPASETRKNNIRSFAFPFDWCISPYQAVYNFIENNFKDYLKKENLVPSSRLYFNQYLQDLVAKEQYIAISEHPLWVLDKETGMIYNHDFPNNTWATINTYHQTQFLKYQRRINRFYEAMRSQKRIYFIRYHDIDKAKSIKLYQLLKDKFPLAKLTLIAIEDTHEQPYEHWNIPHIKNYYQQESSDTFWQKISHDIKTGALL